MDYEPWSWTRASVSSVSRIKVHVVAGWGPWLESTVHWDLWGLARGKRWGGHTATVQQTLMVAATFAWKNVQHLSNWSFQELWPAEGLLSIATIIGLRILEKDRYVYRKILTTSNSANCKVKNQLNLSWFCMLIRVFYNPWSDLILTDSWIGSGLHRINSSEYSLISCQCLCWLWCPQCMMIPCV